MALHLHVKSAVESGDRKNAKLHLMPCLIKSNGEAKVSDYFEPTLANLGQDSLRSSFRGRPLWGREIAVPKRYCGIVLQEPSEKLNEESERNLYGTHLFEKFTYWNKDVEPSGNDKILLALEWLDVAEALHAQDDR